MGFRKEVRERLGKVEVLLETILAKFEADERLVGQNKELFDRLISRNWDEFWKSPTGTKEMEKTEMVMTPQSPLQDEDMVGRIVTDEEIGQPSS